MTITENRRPTDFDPARFEAFIGAVATDVAAAQAVAANHLGERLGLYRHLAGSGPTTAGDLAGATDTNERLIVEWLRGQAVAGYLDHDPVADTYSLPAEHAVVLADESAPVFMGGAFEIAAALWADVGILEQAIRVDGGVDWADHDERLYRGVDRVFGPIYEAHLVADWLPALDGVIDRLEGGVRVADVGCGSGSSSVVIARAFPASHVFGFDRHAPSIDEARARATAEGVTDTTTFAVADAGQLPMESFDLICYFDCLHDMGDPVGAATRARQALTDGGTLMLVEPFATDGPPTVGDPISRLFLAGSLFLCTPCALAQGGQRALGAQAGPAAMTEVLHEAGFGSVQVVATTPFNTVMQARV